MTSSAVKRKALKLLEDNKIVFIGLSRTYTVPHDHEWAPYAVTIGEDQRGGKVFSCTCEHGAKRGLHRDADDICSHIVSCLTLDDRVMDYSKRRKNRG